MTEIEVKITIKEEGFLKILNLLSNNLIKILNQENIFLDTKFFFLNSNQRTLRFRRIRVDNEEDKWVITSKSGGKMINGISIKPEVEEEVSANFAINFLKNPNENIINLPNIIFERIKIIENEPLKIFGHFHSKRHIIQFYNYLIELDECTLPNNKKYYEIEIETNEPEKAKSLIEEFLIKNNIKFHDSKRGKLSRLSKLPSNQRIHPNFNFEN